MNGIVPPKILLKIKCVDQHSVAKFIVMFTRLKVTCQETRQHDSVCYFGVKATLNKMHFLLPLTKLYMTILKLKTPKAFKFLR
jgi:hypothetical protein